MPICIFLILMHDLRMTEQKQEQHSHCHIGSPFFISAFLLSLFVAIVFKTQQSNIYSLNGLLFPFIPSTSPSNLLDSRSMLSLTPRRELAPPRFACFVTNERKLAT